MVHLLLPFVIMMEGYIGQFCPMDVTNRYIATGKIHSELIYFVDDDDGSGVAMQGDRGPSPV